MSTLNLNMHPEVLLDSVKPVIKIDGEDRGEDLELSHQCSCGCCSN